jgi:hypothetical protein
MKKPDWFILADADKPLDPVSSHIPFGVISFILVMVMAGVFFFYPENSPVETKPPVETIQTPILPEFTEDITPVFEEEEDDD